MKPTRAAPILMYCVGAMLCAFGYWGLNTSAGKTLYDEMDALYPAMAFAAGAGFIIAAACIQLWRARRRRARH